jgi:4-amino-4-deoxy-L-arabinose transferase-like glycosyltransferase
MVCLPLKNNLGDLLKSVFEKKFRMITSGSHLDPRLSEKHLFPRLLGWVKAKIRVRKFSSYTGYLLGILLIYGGLLLPTVGRLGISWDEQTDIQVARAYLESPQGWLEGSIYDPSQTRLPMFAVALGYWLFHNSGLILARCFSCLVGALTLVAVYIYGKRRFGVSRGLLASALLATSPFYLSFARVAFTETDIYLACTMAWLVVCVDRFQERPSIRRAALVGILSGLAISAKFTAVVVLIPIWYAVWQSTRHAAAKDLLTQKPFLFTAWLVEIMVCLLGGWYFAHTFSPAVYQGALRLSHYLLIVVGWLLVVVWAIRRYQHTTSWFKLGLFITALAALTFLILPPEHLTNRTILQSLTDRFRQEMGFRAGFMVEAAALHLGSIFFKSSPVMGAGLLASFILPLFQWRDWQRRFPVLVVWVYLGALVVLPLAQTFYTIPLLPLLAVFTADQFLALKSRQLAVAAGLGAAAVFLLVVDLTSCYPDYHLNGYQWLGPRYFFGRPTIGYRSIVQTTSDGVQQTIQWVCENGDSEDRVLVYAYPWHIVEASCPEPGFKISRGQWNSVRTNPDFVIVHINHTIRENWSTWFSSREVDESPNGIFWEPYDIEWLDRNYNLVFSVRRAFGFEMAGVYQRK